MGNKREYLLWVTVCVLNMLQGMSSQRRGNNIFMNQDQHGKFMDRQDVSAVGMIFWLSRQRLQYALKPSSPRTCMWFRRCLSRLVTIQVHEKYFKVVYNKPSKEAHERASLFRLLVLILDFSRDTCNLFYVTRIRATATECTCSCGNFQEWFNYPEGVWLTPKGGMWGNNVRMKLG